VTVVSHPSSLLSTARPEKSATALAARFGTPSQRPALRADLIVRRLVRLEDVSWVVKNPETLKVYSFEAVNWGLIELFDGTRTREQIAEEYNRRHSGGDISVNLVLDYEDSLRRFGLLEQGVAERNLALLESFKNARREAAKEKAEGFNIFLIPFHVFDPDRFLNRTVKYVRWLWTPPAATAAAILFLLTASVFVRDWSALWRQTVELYSFLKRPFWDVVQFFVILTVIGAIHEFGHAYATKIYGGEVHDVGVALFYFTPAFYCDTTDAFLFQNKWHRLWVKTAGIYVESFLCFGATGLWLASYPDTLLHELAYKTMLYTGISTVFFNINPAIKSDGYHVVANTLEILQLREESFAYIGALFQRHLLRLPVELPRLSRRKRRIFWIYAPYAIVYTAFIMYLVGRLFFNLYSKYFPDIAVLLLVPTLILIFRKRARVFIQVFRLFYLDKKEFLMSRRARPYLAGIAAALFLILAIPWSRRTIRTNIVLRPVSLIRVEAPEDGMVLDVRARERDDVQRGQVMANLASATLESRVLRLAAEGDRLQKEASRRRESADAGGIFQTSRRKSAVDALQRTSEIRKEHLTVRSPSAGRILTPRTEDLTGRFVRAGTLLAEIGDCRRLTAEIPVSERLVTDLRVGAPVSVQLRAQPTRILLGFIVSVSPATLSLPGTAGRAKDATRPLDRPERFVAMAQFENPEGWILPGMSGSGKILLERASYLSGAWRVAREWVQRTIW